MQGAARGVRGVGIHDVTKIPNAWPPFKASMPTGTHSRIGPSCRTAETVYWTLPDSVRAHGREPPLQLNAARLQLHYLRRQPVRRIRNEAQIQNACRRLEMSAEHKVAVVSVEGDDDSPLFPAQPQDILVSCTRRDLGYGEDVLARTPQCRHRPERDVLVREQLHDGGLVAERVDLLVPCAFCGESEQGAKRLPGQLGVVL